MQTLMTRLDSAAKDSASLAKHLATRREARPPARSRDRGRERSPGKRPGPYPRSVVHRSPAARPPGPDRHTGGSRDQHTHRRPPYGRGGRGGKNSFNKGRPAFHQYSLSESHLGGLSPPLHEARAKGGRSSRVTRDEQSYIANTGFPNPGALPPLHEARAKGGRSSRVTRDEQSYNANTGFPDAGARPPLHEARARGGRSSSRVTCGEQSRTYDVGPAEHVTALGAHGTPGGGGAMTSRVPAPVPPLTDFYDIWKEQGLLSDVWLEKTLRRGYALQFFRKPPPFRGVRAVRSQVRGSTEALEAEVSSLLSRGAAVEVDPQDATRGLYSPYFLVPKKSGGVRPILDLRVLNECISKRQFRMLSTRQLLECVREGDWMTSIDLTDAYFHVSIVPEHRRFLRFAVGERNYEYCRLPFGYALAPRTFSKCVEAALEPIRRAGVRILTYIDDWLILAPSREVAVSHTQWVLSHIQRLGFVVNREKSKLQPAQRMIYLGLQLDSVIFRAALSVDRRTNITRLAREVLAGPRVPARRLRSLLGMMAAAHAVVRLGLLHMRNFQRWFSRLRLHPSRDGGRLIWVPQGAASDIRFWLTPGLLRDGVTLACAVSHAEVFTDASLEGWGGVLGQSSVGGCWSDSARHINLLEMEAVHRVLLHFAPQLQGRHVMVRSDNTTVVSYLNRQGGTRSPALHRMATVTLLWAALHLLSLRARHVPGVRNVGADRMSRGGPLQDEWGLAPRVAAEIWRRFGRPVVDLFASAENAQCPSWFALRAADEPPLGVDALAHYPWPGGLLYAFPPVRLLPVLLRRIEQERRRSVILVAPDSPHARWFPFLRGMAVMEPWALPDEPGALVQGAGALFSRPIIGRRLWVTTGFGGFTARSHPLIKRFLRGARRRRPPLQRTPPVWDLRVVLRGLSGSPFEPAAEASPDCIAFKTALLLALASAKRAGDLCALSVHASCLSFGEDDGMVELWPNPAFLPKVITSAFRSRVIRIRAFHPPPHASPEEERQHLLCPIRMLRHYLAMTSSFRSGDQLFVCLGPKNRGAPLSAQRLAHWVATAVRRAYQAQGLAPPVGFRSHSTRGMAASTALLRGASVEDVCRAASWASSSSFVRSYLSDVSDRSLEEHEQRLLRVLHRLKQYGLKLSPEKCKFFQTSKRVGKEAAGASVDPSAVREACVCVSHWRTGQEVPDGELSPEPELSSKRGTQSSQTTASSYSGRLVPGRNGDMSRPHPVPVFRW
uniref:ribonuclease H n=1 Tax=Knipowitschia caucasica TaxID=637954 RepID=A0AAV2IU46_KNICA